MSVVQDELWRQRRKTARKVLRAFAEEHEWPDEDVTIVTEALGLRGEL